ncbi:MAG: hypothetical protein JWP88_522 [Flaviaesturariibacter sp.]|nr:hypothetical protein [Flaviaesturariibacter sp.]
MANAFFMNCTKIAYLRKTRKGQLNAKKHCALVNKAPIDAKT